ncbi:conserved hypothetical protein [Dehalogenimonas lykanthroporepellens BL-DC-9]|jgi:hypothetical protein|nr:conserved hypothetical protein [Dehalogenimonas lykanthroporepellens BL-DC-9]
MYRKVLVIVLVTVLAATAAGCFTVGSIVGRGPVETRDFEFDSFTRLQVSSAFEVTVARSDEFSVSVTTNENLFDYLDLSRVGDTLSLRLKSGSYTFASLKARVTMPDIFSAEITSASEATISGFEFTHALNLTASGASQIHLTDMTTGELTLQVSGASRLTGDVNSGEGSFNISGASTLELSGSGGGLTVTGSGASTVALKEFTAGNIGLDFSGATTGSVRAGGRLDVTLSGASSLRYFGNPVIGDVNVSGGSSLNSG